MDVPQLRQKILDFARHEENIRLVVETGAFARKFPPADELSDLDIELYSQNPQRLLNSRAWIEELGNVLICLELANDGFNPTRLVIFKGGAKVDFAIYDIDLVQGGFRSQAQQRGYLIHLDKGGITSGWAGLKAPRVEKPDAKTWRALIDGFWLDNYNLAKYLARGDGWTAKFLDAEIKGHVLKMLEWHGAMRGVDVWHLGHHLQNWTDEATYTEIKTLFAGFDAVDSRRTMWATCDLFGRLAREVGEAWELEYPEDLEGAIQDLMRKGRSLQI